MKSSKSKYKALIVDIDGTLIKDFHDRPSKRLTQAIQKASKKVHVGLATSRPLMHTFHIMDHLLLSGPSIVTNGAEIIDSTSKKILFQQPFEKETMSHLIPIIEKYHLTALINENGQDVEYQHGYTWEHTLDVWFPSVPDKYLESIRKELDQIPSIYYWDGASQHRGYDMVITHAAATKQHGILEVAKILGIDTHEIIGIGDGPNDFPLLMACGLKVAMGNAIEDLKAIADYVAPPVTEDGVADVIEKFILSP